MAPREVERSPHEKTLAILRRAGPIPIPDLTAEVVAHRATALAQWRLVLARASPEYEVPATGSTSAACDGLRVKGATCKDSATSCAAPLSG